MNGMVRKFQSLGALLLTIVAGLAGAQGIPNLSGYDRETRQSMELACVSEKVNGPVAYGACLNSQIASLHGFPGIPDLSGYDRETRQSMELACVSKKVNGPVAYGACLNSQIASLQGSPGIPNLGGYNRESRQTVELASPTSTSPRDTLPPSFSTANIMKVHSGMSSNAVLELFGEPRDISSAVCGREPNQWICTTWGYGKFPYGHATFTFSGKPGKYILNNFDVKRD